MNNKKPTGKQSALAALTNYGPMTLPNGTTRHIWAAYEALVLDGVAVREVVSTERRVVKFSLSTDTK